MGFSHPKTFPGKQDKVYISKQVSTINIYDLISKDFLYHEQTINRNIGSLTGIYKENTNSLLGQQAEEKVLHNKPFEDLLIPWKRNLDEFSEVNGVL